MTTYKLPEVEGRIIEGSDAGLFGTYAKVGDYSYLLEDPNRDRLIQNLEHALARLLKAKELAEERKANERVENVSRFLFGLIYPGRIPFPAGALYPERWRHAVREVLEDIESGKL